MNSELPLKSAIKILGLLLVVAAIAAGVYLVKVPSLSAPVTEPTTPVQVLAQRNADYARALASYEARDYVTAEAALKSVLSDPNAEISVAERGQIENTIAASMEKQGRYIEAINLYASVGVNPEYTRPVRANALMQIGEIYYRYSDPEILQVTATHPSLSRMVVPGNIGLSYRNLYEAASALYPLPLAEARIADWYARDLQPKYNAGKTFDSEMGKSLAIVRQKLASIDAGIQQTEAGSNGYLLIPETLERKAAIIARLALMDQEPKESVDAAYELAEKSYVDILGVSGTFVYFQHALYLEKLFGAERADDIRSLLAKIYDADLPEDSPINQFLADERKNLHGVRSTIVDLASVDPKFKTYLVSLGWQESDF